MTDQDHALDELLPIPLTGRERRVIANCLRFAAAFQEELDGPTAGFEHRRIATIIEADHPTVEVQA